MRAGRQALSLGSSTAGATPPTATREASSSGPGGAAASRDRAPGRGPTRLGPPGPRACAPFGALKFKFERPWSATEPALRAEPTGCGRARRPASCLPPELRRARTHFFPSPEFEPPDPPSRLPHVRPGAMDPFTEVRDSAGAVNHDPRGPPPALPVSLWPTGGSRGACAPRACSQAEAAGVAGCLPGFAAPTGQLQTLG